MKLHSLTADTPAGCVTYHSLTVDLPLQRYFWGFFTRVSTCICIRLHHFSNRGESRTVHGSGVVLDLILMCWFVSSVSGKNKRTHTHTQTHTHYSQIYASDLNRIVQLVHSTLFAKQINLFAKPSHNTLWKMSSFPAH